MPGTCGLLPIRALLEPVLSGSLALLKFAGRGIVGSSCGSVCIRFAAAQKKQLTQRLVTQLRKEYGTIVESEEGLTRAGQRFMQRHFHIGDGDPLPVEDQPDIETVSISASEARKTLCQLIQRVNEDRVAVEIVSRHGNAVLMPADEYAAWKETAYLIRSPANARRLLDAYERALTSKTEVQSSTWGIERGLRSRRVKDEHRLVYFVDGDDLVTLQARYHY